MKRGIFVFAALVLFVAGPASAAYFPATTNGWFPLAGRTGGGASHSDLWLFNPDTNPVSAPVTVTLIFHPAVASGAGAAASISSSLITLAARETRYIPDVTFNVVPAADGVFGTVEWQSSKPLLGVLRNVTASGGGTLGPLVAATPRTESMQQKNSPTDAVNVLHLFGLNSGDTNFTTRLDVSNTSDIVVPVEVRVVDPTTNIVYGGVQNYSIAPRSLLRVGTILQAVAAPLIDGLRITVAVKETATVTLGGVIASATVTDNRTNDSTAILGQRSSAASSGLCVPDAQTLCLSDNRFKVTATYQSGAGSATAIPGTSDTGQFWFFSASNVEMVIKVLNGCGINNRYWVFAGGLTNVQVTMTVADMSNGTIKTYVNPQSTPFQPIQDTSAFATCP